MPKRAGEEPGTTADQERMQFKLTCGAVLLGCPGRGQTKRRRLFPAMTSMQWRTPSIPHTLRSSWHQKHTQTCHLHTEKYTRHMDRCSSCTASWLARSLSITADSSGPAFFSVHIQTGSVSCMNFQCNVS